MIVDSNVVIELLHGTGRRAEQVIEAYTLLAARRGPRINPVIFAECASGSPSLEAFEARLDEMGIAIEGFENADSYRASIAFRAYRQKGGPRSTILPDFMIGAQAANRNWPLMTNDTKRFATYFPEIELLDPMDFRE
jgi:predicted nucleic acid-binding protein